MMRAVVFSDVHRRTSALFDIIERHKENADLFISLGDDEESLDEIQFVYPDLKIEAVCGNNDWNSRLPFYKTITFAGKRIFICHGHTFYVKHGNQKVIEEAKKNNADICLFGHTHTSLVTREDGLYIMNPGAVCTYEYGIIDIVNEQILTYTTKI